MAVEARELADDEWLSQCGTRRGSGDCSFPNRPRPQRDPVEIELSWQIGRLSAGDATALAFGPLRRLKPGKDAVRHVQVGVLRSAGFRVEHTPYLGSPLHVSVFWDGEEWGDKEADLLHSCCSEGVV